jgi:hypothetical protein
MNLLPDSRAKHVKRIFRFGQAWVPVFCANCGKEGGMCPEENMTFIFYQCNACHEKLGHITGTMVMPDEVFYKKLAEEQLENYGRFLSEQELIMVVEEDASPLATLLKEGQ